MHLSFIMLPRKYAFWVVLSTYVVVTLGILFHPENATMPRNDVAIAPN